MRRVLLSDAIHLARALAQQPPSFRAAVLDRWLVQTQAASKYLRRFGRPHSDWGDGSLTSRALKATARNPAALTPDGAEFYLVLAQVANRLAAIGQSRLQVLS